MSGYLFFWPSACVAVALLTYALFVYFRDTGPPLSPRFGWADRILMRIFRYRVLVNSCNEPYLIRYFIRGQSASGATGEKRGPTSTPMGDKSAIYLHHILRSDEDRALHDHPFPFVSLILWSGYTEVTHSGERRYGVGSILRRHAEFSHRLVLDRPAWTLVFRGARVRVWGFHTPAGWMPWNEYIASADYKSRAGKPPCE